MSRREGLINGVCIMALVLVPLVALWLDKPYVITLATKVCILAMAGVGLNLVLGYGGLVSFGHAAFFGLGGYVAGILASHALNYEPIMQSPWLVEGTTRMLVIWPVVIVTCAMFALCIGALSLRTSGVYFIMITLAFAQMIYYFSISWPSYGGEDGLSVYLRSSFPGLNTMTGIHFFAISLFWLLLSMWLTSRMVQSRFGLALQAARQNPVRVAAVGISAYRVQLTAFVISGVITGIAGALYTDLNRFVSPSMLSWHTSGEIMVFVILGGVARLAGPLVGAALFICLEQTLGSVSDNWQFWLGAVLIVVVLYARGGVVGLLVGEGRRG